MDTGAEKNLGAIGDPIMALSARQSLSKVCLSFPFYYTIMPAMRYNIRMTDNFHDRLSINASLSMTFAYVRKNRLSYKRWGNAGKRWVKIAPASPC